MKLSPERIMAQVRDQLVSDAAMAAGCRPTLVGTHSMDALAKDGLTAAPMLKPGYVLDELLAFQDLPFVLNAYRAILRREPDQDGLELRLDHLRRGILTKVEILADLRWSPEGMARGIHIDGLLIPTVLQRWKRKPIIGPVIAWLHAVARLPALARRLSLAEAAAGRDRTLLTEFVHDSADTNAQAAERALYAALEAGRTSKETREALESRIHGLEACLSGRLDIVESKCNACLESVERVAQEHNAAFAKIERDARQREQAEPDLDAMYVAFEERFRGSPALIKARVAPYLEDIREAGVGGHATPVVDLGCGNGEWLAVLRENEFVAHGIDNNRVFTALCSGRGLDVEHADAFEALAARPDRSVGAITAMHLVEHLPFAAVVRLLDEAMRVLCTGGILILETPNPENILVAAHYFYTDPTHRNPIPPETLQWLVEARGFQRVQVRRLTEAREMQVHAPVPDAAPGSEAINAVIARLDAAPDYAVIARKL